MIARQLDRLFPPRLAVADSKDFRSYWIGLTAMQLRISIWLSAFTYASYGLWDIFGADGGVLSTRFRYFLACPVMIAFALAAGTPFASKHRRRFVLAFLISAIVLVFGSMILIDRELPFKIATGNGTINYYLVSLMGFGLVPLSLLDGLVFGVCVIAAHALLITMYSKMPFTIQSSWDFHIVCAVTIGMFITYWREWFIRSEFHNTLELSDEKERLKNALVGYVSLDALKRKHGEVIADAFGEVSLLFCDIAGFTALTERLAPKHLIELLGRIFAAFDTIIERAGAEKVKTIGDSYMVIAGTKLGDDHHAHQLAVVALEMNDALETIAGELGYPLQLRSGIHTGSIIGGVIGDKKPIYDYWGRTVNIASRLEGASAPGRIQISEATYWRVKDAFVCEPRGEIELRDIGKVNCYFLNACREGEASPV